MAGLHWVIRFECWWMPVAGAITGVAGEAMAQLFACMLLGLENISCVAMTLPLHNRSPEFRIESSKTKGMKRFEVNGHKPLATVIGRESAATMPGASGATPVR